MITLFLCFIPVIALFGAGDADQIKDIIVIGNEKTKTSVILREMKSRVGQVFDPALLQRDQQRIENLQLFNRVETDVMEQPDGIVILVLLTERWYIFPYPVFYANERDWKKLSYGAGVVHRNFRGRNTHIGVSGWLGYNPGFSLYYDNSWIGGDAHLYLKLKAFQGTVRSRGISVPRFDQTARGMQVDIGKRWGLGLYSSLVLSYQSLGFPAVYSDLSAGGSGTDRLPSVAVVIKYDQRDRIDYAKSGIYTQTFVEKVHYPHQVDYLRSGLDLRLYVPLGAGISLALRGRGDMLKGDRPMYARYYLGYSERIRGHYDQVRQGDYRLLGHVELRVPILSLHYLSMNEEMFGSYSSNMPLAVNGALFCDSGTTWYEHEEFDRDRVLSGYGAGLHLVLPYSYVLRFDYGFDFEGNGQFIFDLNAWF